MKVKQQSKFVEILTNVKDFSEYQLLSLVNRTVNKQHVNQLVRSFIRFGTAGANVIVVQTRAFNIKRKLEYYIADGQHSIEASAITKLGLNVTVIRLVEDTQKNVTQYIAALNNTSKAWSNKNYTNSFASIKVYEYERFREIVKETGLLTNDLLYIFLGGASQKEVKEYKSGNMVFKDEDKSIDMLNAVMKCKDRIPNKTFVRRALYSLMITHGNYDFIANAINDSKVLEFSENEAVFKQQIEGVYGRALAKVHMEKAIELV